MTTKLSRLPVELNLLCIDDIPEQVQRVFTARVARTPSQHPGQVIAYENAKATPSKSSTYSQEGHGTIRGILTENFYDVEDDADKTGDYDDELLCSLDCYDLLLL